MITKKKNTLSEKTKATISWAMFATSFIISFIICK